MHVNDFDGKKAGVLFFDILNHFYRDENRKVKVGMQTALDNALKIRDAARKAGMPSFFAHGNHRSDGATNARLVTDTDMALRPWPNGEITHRPPRHSAGSWEAAVLDDLGVKPEDYLVPKYRWSAFFQTYLDLALRTRGIDTIIICGCATDVGIASTTFSARDMDYSAILVHDACVGENEEAHKALMERVFPRMARIRTTDEVLRMITGGKK
jgi:nicotinamidase-related amidase